MSKLSKNSYHIMDTGQKITDVDCGFLVDKDFGSGEQESTIKKSPLLSCLIFHLWVLACQVEISF